MEEEVIIVVREVSNTKGNLSIKVEDEKYFWSLGEEGTEDWKEIPASLYFSIYEHNVNSILTTKRAKLTREETVKPYIQSGLHDGLMKILDDLKEGAEPYIFICEEVDKLMTRVNDSNDLIISLEEVVEYLDGFARRVEVLYPNYELVSIEKDDGLYVEAFLLNK